MRLRRFYCEDLSQPVAVLAPEEARHARDVLRLGPGARLLLFDGRGTVGEGELLPAEPTAVRSKRPSEQRVAILSRTVTPHPVYELCLIVAPPKGDLAAWTVEKCTELGVSEIRFAGFERAVAEHARPAALAKLQRAALEACKQCGRDWLPRVTVHTHLDDALDGRLPATGWPGFVGDLTPQTRPLVEWLGQRPGEPQICGVIGPEGGLTDSERARLAAAGLAPVRLSTHVLRIETAAIAAAAVWAAGQGDGSEGSCLFCSPQ